MIPVITMTYRDLLNSINPSQWGKVTGGREINQELLDVEVEVAKQPDGIIVGLWIKETGEQVVGHE